MMRAPDEGRGKRAGVRVCMACERFGILPAQPAVDSTGSSADEADRLCRTHRERVLRGSCFMCGGDDVWASPFSDRSIGCCRACLFKHHGLNAARRIEVELENDRQEEMEGGEDPSASSWN
ncbi:MAG: hypothetical protein L0170_13225 [Acidobacteria bacterium]|nr:hypothetical protein [Acidobacteriota bacterium]